MTNATTHHKSREVERSSTEQQQRNACELDRHAVIEETRIVSISKKRCNYSAGMADVRQGGTIGLPAKTLVNASMTLPPFLRMVEM